MPSSLRERQTVCHEPLPGPGQNGAGLVLSQSNRSTFSKIAPLAASLSSLPNAHPSERNSIRKV